MANVIDKIISGRQTGVDWEALDAAMEAGIHAGGYCPKGRLAEDGAIPAYYPVLELNRGGNAARTEKNVMESHGTLILNVGKLSGGTRLTLDCSRKHGNPSLVIQLAHDPKTEPVIQWAKEHLIRVLNIAGPRESKNPGQHDSALAFLRRLLKEA